MKDDGTVIVKVKLADLDAVRVSAESRGKSEGLSQGSQAGYLRGREAIIKAIARALEQAGSWTIDDMYRWMAHEGLLGLIPDDKRDAYRGRP